MWSQLEDSKKKAQTSREVRSETRRLQSTFSEYLDMGDLFKFNQLKVSFGKLFSVFLFAICLSVSFLLK